MSHAFPLESQAKVAVIGGGVAGSVVALRLAELGIDTTLLEQGQDLVSGPPMCHLHAGGNLYREITDEQCLALLQQSIDTLKLFAHCTNWRPTVIAIPTEDAGTPEALFPRLQILRSAYQAMVSEDPSNEVLGAPEDYFHCFYRQDLEKLRKLPTPKVPVTASDWMIPVAKHMDLDALKYPLIQVQEFGLSSFRVAATVSLALNSLPSAKVLTGHRVVNVQRSDSNNLSHTGWEVGIERLQDNQKYTQRFDYLINACGYKSGALDDMLKIPRQRMVEFKAAYLARWQQVDGQWPEVIVHGERGTPNGMAQLTPYVDGYFQLHGMTENITLFPEGLVKSDETSAQPVLSPTLQRKLAKKWHPQEITQRTNAAIKHVARYVPGFQSAQCSGNPLFGAQQIPGYDPSLRAADVSYFGEAYARVEIVKASSALASADRILQTLVKQDFVSTLTARHYVNKHFFPATKQLSEDVVCKYAEEIAHSRQYPPELARVFGRKMCSAADRKAFTKQSG